MPLGPGTTDAQGVRLYGEDDETPLTSDLLNLAPQSISTQLQAIRAQLAAIPKTARGQIVDPAGVAGAGGAKVYGISFPAGLYTGPPHVSLTSEMGRFTLAASAITKDGASVTVNNWSPAIGVGTIRWEARGL